MGEIYIAENKMNGMVYVGKTTKTMAERKKDHKTKALRKINNLRFHNAIRSYGSENFEWRVLTVCDNSILDEQEIYYIKLYKANNKKFGYNMTEGGDNDPMCNLGRKFSKEHRANISKAAANRVITDEARRNMSKAQKERYQKDDSLRRILLGIRVTTKIDQYDLNGYLIKTWPSMIEASEAVGVDSSNISKACSGKAKTSAGFIWRYHGDDLTKAKLEELTTPKKLTDEHKNKISGGLRKKVIQFDLKGNFIKTWEGVDVAAKHVGVAKSGIIRSCKGEQLKSGGFIWEYKEDQ